MKEGKQECAKPKPPPKPNMKNKDFVKWTRAESCKKEDNIISTDWHERLQRTPLFTPVYDNAPLNMVYLLSGEYGRMWQKERDEWYSTVFVLNSKDQDMFDRRKKIRKQAREAKKAAQLNIQERKARKAKELEAKLKADQEKAEKLKAKIQKSAAKKKPKKPKSQTDSTSAPSASQPKNENCPKDWTPVELNIQCECSSHKKEEPSPVSETQEVKETEANQQPEQNSPTMCEDYLKQLAVIQNKKEEEEAKTEPEPC